MIIPKLIIYMRNQNANARIKTRKLAVVKLLENISAGYAAGDMRSVDLRILKSVADAEALMHHQTATALTDRQKRAWVRHMAVNDVKGYITYAKSIGEVPHPDTLRYYSEYIDALKS